MKLLNLWCQNGVVSNFGQLVDPEGVRQELSHMKALHVDGVIVNCWWGIVEAWNPQKYAWSGYRELFNIVREFNLKLQVTFLLLCTSYSKELCMFIYDD